jgi:hypothetical protein
MYYLVATKPTNNGTDHGSFKNLWGTYGELMGTQLGGRGIFPNPPVLRIPPEPQIIDSIDG